MALQLTLEEEWIAVTQELQSCLEDPETSAASIFQLGDMSDEPAARLSSDKKLVVSESLCGFRIVMRRMAPMPPKMNTIIINK
jgi:hypothetical protein